MLKKSSEELPNIEPEKQTKPRGQIKHLSYGSTKRARRILRNLPDSMTHEVGLTYPRNFPRDGAIVKSHLHKLMLRFRYRGIRMFWFMEFQKRGACHFHAIIDKEISNDELLRIWHSIIRSDDNRHLKRGAHIAPIRSPKGFRKYLSAYLTKEEQKRVPYFYKNAGRFWGYSRSLVPVYYHVLVGSKENVRLVRRNLRIFRRWQTARYRKWNNGKKFNRHKMLNLNPYVFIMPGEYLTVLDAHELIQKLKGTPLDSILFEGWADDPEAKPGAPAP